MPRSDASSVSSTSWPTKVLDSAAPLSFREFPVWLLYVYTRLDASLERRFRRACISVAFGIVLYAVGFGIAVATHFVMIYVESPPIYLVTFMFMFFMGRARWLGLEILERANKLQEVFLVPPQQYFSALRPIGQRATALRATISISTVLVLGAWLAVALVYFAPTSLPGSYLASLEPHTFPQAWFASSNTWGKMLVIDWFLTVAILFATPVFYGTTVIVLSILGTAKHWPVVPIPAYVAAKSLHITGFFNVGGLIYAIAVLSLVLLYGGGASLQLVVMVSLFVLVGLLCVLLPPVVMQRLVSRASEQLTTSVAEQYRSSIYPVASHLDSFSSTVQQDVLSETTAKELIRYQELLQATNQTTVLQSQLLSLAPAILSQSLPYFGIAITALIKSPHI